MNYVHKLSHDYTSYTNEQRISTYYIEIIKSDQLQDKIMQTQLNTLQLSTIYNGLNDLVTNIIAIANGDRQLILDGQIFRIQEHNFKCNNTNLSCAWDIDTQLLQPVSEHKRKCQKYSTVFRC